MTYKHPQSKMLALLLQDPEADDAALDPASTPEDIANTIKLAIAEMETSRADEEVISFLDGMVDYDRCKGVALSIANGLAEFNGDLGSAAMHPLEGALSLQFAAADSLVFFSEYVGIKGSPQRTPSQWENAFNKFRERFIRERRSTYEDRIKYAIRSQR